LPVNPCYREKEKDMAGQRGRDVLIRIGDGGSPEAFVTVAGIRTRTIALSAGLVDATTAQSPQAWRQLIAGAGTKRVEVAGSGVFVDAISDARLRAAYFNGEAASLRLVIAGFGVLAGPFAIAELTHAGEHDDEATFAIRLASAGVIAFEDIGDEG
jgi:TP901-1 family phage major tail protein